MDATPKTMDEIERAAVEASFHRHGGNRKAMAAELVRCRDWVRKRVKDLKLPLGKPGRPKTD